MVDSQAEFLMEVTDKTKADIKVDPDSSLDFSAILMSRPGRHPYRLRRIHPPARDRAGSFRACGGLQVW